MATKRAPLAARAKALARRLRRLEHDVTLDEATEAWLANAERTLDRVELAVFGYRDRGALYFDILADHVDTAGATSFAKDAGHRGRLAVLVRDEIAEQHPELAERLDLSLLASAIEAFAAKHSKKWEALHTLAAKAGVRGKADSLRTSLLRARKRRGRRSK